MTRDDLIARVVSEGESYGRSDACGGRRVQVECVSADPNGPLTAVHARSGVVGDAVANLLSAVGCEVSRESFVNDVISNSQMVGLGEAVFARYMEILGRDSSVPEEGYEGDFVTDIASGIAEESGDSLASLPDEERVARFARLAEERMLALQWEQLDRLGVKLDVWFLEQPLHEGGEVERVIGMLRDKGFTYEESGALWMRSSEMGDDADRVLVRSNGQTTYIAADAAYHLNKFERGFDRVIDVWGPEHQGYIARTKAVLSALGCDAGRLEVLVLGGVRMVSGDEIVASSRHGRGSFLLSDLLDEAGADSVRFMMLLREVGEPLDFDLDAARMDSERNPLMRVRDALAGSGGSGGSEEDVLGMVESFPSLVSEAARRCEPSLVAKFAVSLADAMRACGDTSVLSAARVALGNSLRLLGVSE